MIGSAEAIGGKGCAVTSGSIAVLVYPALPGEELVVLHIRPSSLFV